MERSANYRERDIFTPHSAFYQTKQPPEEKRTIHYKTKLSSDPGKWVFNLPIAGIHSDEPVMNILAGTLSGICAFLLLKISLVFFFFFISNCGQNFIKRERKEKKESFRVLCPLQAKAEPLPLCKLQSSGEFSLLIA